MWFHFKSSEITGPHRSLLSSAPGDRHLSVVSYCMCHGRLEHLYERDSPMLFLNVPWSLHGRDSLNTYERMDGEAGDEKGGDTHSLVRCR